MANSDSSETPALGSAYVKLALKDIRAIDLPNIQKTSIWPGKSRSRELRLACVLDGKPRNVGWWKAYSESLDWTNNELTFPAVRKASQIIFQIRSKHSHKEEDRIALQSEPVTVESLIEPRADRTSIMLEPVPTTTATRNATVSFVLEATVFGEENIDAVKEAVSARVSPHEKWANMVEPLRKILALGTGIAEVEGHAKIALACVKVACDTFIKPLELDTKVLKLMDDVEGTLRLVLEVDTSDKEKILTDSQRKLLPKLMHQANECMLFIQEYTSQSYLGTVAKALVKNYDGIISDYFEALRSLKEHFRSSQLWNTQVVVHRLSTALIKLEHKIDTLQLGLLRITVGAGHNPALSCLSGTRVTILEDIRTWIHGGEGDTSRLLLLIGQAGVGKSAIAHSIATEYSKVGRLASAFFFSKDRDSSNFYRTIARNMADMDPLYFSLLSENVNIDMATSSHAAVQMEKVLLAPFENSSVFGPIVIVIDAVDECNDRKTIIDCLIQNIDKFPTNVRFLVTSRPSEARALAECSWVSVHDLEREEEAATDDDILRYVKYRLKTYISGQKAGDLNPTDLDLIVTASEKLFQYAAVVCTEMLSAFTYQSRESPKQTFDRLVRNSKAGLDALYTGILDFLYPSDELQDFQHVMGLILVAEERLTHAALVDLGTRSHDPSAEELGYDSVSRTLRPLGALFSGTQDPKTPVYPLHSSFRNYLLDGTRSKRFYIGTDASQHASMASVSLRLMVQRLHFNMAGLESSYVLNNEVPHFQDRVDAAIPKSLSYACTHWATHLRLSLVEDAIVENSGDLDALMTQKFLFWLEALGLLKEVGTAITACQFLLMLSAQNKLRGLTRDRLEQCLTFIINFGVVVSEATPHLYLSGVALDKTILPDDSIFTGLTSVSASLSERHQGLLLTIRGHEDVVNSAKFSPDGKTIASASDDKTLRIWDSQTGVQIGAPLRGHKAPVKVVCFSSDGTKIASGSADTNIRVWDARTRTLVGLPLCGHEDSVTTVLFSPDGSQIISGSTDATIRIWDLQTRKSVTLRGHDGGILAASFTPDGRCIVSASSDGRVHIWNEIPASTYSVFQTVWMSGMMSACLSTDTMWLNYTVQDYRGRKLGMVDRRDSADRTGLRSSNYYYRSLALSSDARYCVYKSDERDFCIWDTESTTSSSSFIGHEDSIESACFSTDETRIVSASKDKTIRVWTRGVREQNKKQSTSRLSSTIRKGGIDDYFMSPDMSTISTFSSYMADNRVWDLRTQLSRRLLGHTDMIPSCAYSPDSAHIVTTCGDNIVRLWDAHTGKQIGSFEHPDWVSSASFSHDGTKIVSASISIHIWDLQTGEQCCAPLSGHEKRVSDASFSPDGHSIVSVSRDETIRVWDTKSGAQIGNVMNSTDGPHHSAVFSQNGTHIVSLTRQKMHIWDTQTQMQLCVLSHHNSFLRSATFVSSSVFPNGQTVLHAPSNKKFYLWDVRTNTQIGAPFSGHQGFVSSAVFLPDGKLVVSASSDKTVRIWDVETRAEICSPLRGHTTRVFTASFSPDGKQIISEDGTVFIWDLEKYLRVPFTDTQLWYALDLESGWFKTLEGKHMLWIPPVYRRHTFLWSPIQLRAFLGPEVRLRSEHTFHGLDWAKCYVGES